MEDRSVTRSAACRCGHTAGWHSHGGAGDCEHDGECACEKFVADERVAASGSELIAAERQRQIDAEGWTPEHDDGHADGELALAAATYAVPHEGRQAVVWMTNEAGTQLTKHFLRRILWPLAWGEGFFKPASISMAIGAPSLDDQVRDGRVRELAKAGALIAAEIDRLQRAKS